VNSITSEFSFLILKNISLKLSQAYKPSTDFRITPKLGIIKHLL